jgi:hypothetical protein
MGRNNKMILDYKSASTWDSLVAERLTDLLGRSYSEKIKGNAESIEYRDSDSEACNLFVDCVGRGEIRKHVIEGLSSNFTEVNVYHACRPTRIEDYYQYGIKPLCPREVQQQFRVNFSPYATQEEINEAIESVPLDTRDGVVHVVLDDRELSGHYLIYGSEYLNCLAIHLPGASEATRDILKNFGKATVLECRIPFSYVDDLEYLASSMVADHCFRIAHNREDVCEIDYTITINKTILPNNIIGHYCPKKIEDPYKHRRIWNDALMDYE